MQAVDITGQRFGRLSVLSFEGIDGRKGKMWKVQCECGEERVVMGCNLMRGHTRSCGCLSQETRARPRKKTEKRVATPYTTTQPKILLSFVQRGWLWHNDKAFPIVGSPTFLFKSFLTSVSPKEALESERVFNQVNLEEVDRWWLLCWLVENKVAIQIYKSREEAELSNRTVVV